MLVGVHQDSRVDAGDAVEDGFGEIHSPFAFPRSDDVLHLCVCIYHVVVAYFFGIFADFLFVHGEYVEGLVKLDPFAEPSVFSIIAIYHSIELCRIQ